MCRDRHSFSTVNRTASARVGDCQKSDVCSKCVYRAGPCTMAFRGQILSCKRPIRPRGGKLISGRRIGPRPPCRTAVRGRTSYGISRFWVRATGGRRGTQRTNLLDTSTVGFRELAFGNARSRLRSRRPACEIGDPWVTRELHFGKPPHRRRPVRGRRTAGWGRADGWRFWRMASL